MKIAEYTFKSGYDILPTFNSEFLNTEIYSGTVYANKTINIGVIDPNAKISFFVKGFERPLGSGTVYDNYIEYMPSIGLSLYHYTDGTESKITTNDEPVFTRGISVQIVIENIAYTDVDNGDGTTTRTITSNSSPSSISFNSKTELLSVDYLDTSNVTNMSGMFRQCEKLKSIDLSSFDTSQVTDMKEMFFDCVSLISLDLSNFNTSNVTDMTSMFDFCEGLTLLNLSNFDTSKVTSMRKMFYDCLCLESLDVSNFDTSNVTDMNGMFYDCLCLESLDVSNFDTSNVTDMSSMFSSCNNLTSLDVSNFDTSNVTDMNGMFSGCNSLTSLDVSNFDTRKATGMSAMFYGCNSLTSLDVSNFDTSKVIDMSAMFYGCISLASLDLSSFNTSSVTTMYGMFVGCQSLISLDLSHFDTSSVTDMLAMFTFCTNLASLDLSHLDTSKVESMDGMFMECTNLTSINMANTDYNSINKIITELPTRSSSSYGTLNVYGVDNYNNVNVNTANSKYWNIVQEAETLTIAEYTFKSNTDTLPIFNSDFTYEYTDVDNSDGTTTRTITSDTLPTSISFDRQYKLISVNYLNISNVTDMSGMFQHCQGLTSIESSNWDTSNVTDMSYMFQNCSNLTSLDVSNWNTSNVTDMDAMFLNCPKLTSIDVSNFNTSNVTGMGSMFSRCQLLTSMDVSNWNTSKVRTMGGMFSYCSGLTALDLSNFNTDKVYDMSSMFFRCTSLKILDLSNFNTRAISYISNMFQDCSNLASISMSNCDTNSVNEIISVLPTRTSGSFGTLTVKKSNSTIETTTANNKYWNVTSNSRYSLTRNILKYFLTKLKEKFAFESELDDKVDKVMLQEEVPGELWIKEQLKYGNNEYYIEVPYFNSFDCIKIEIDSKIYDKNDFVGLDSEYDSLGNLKVGNLDIEIRNDSYGNSSMWEIYVYVENISAVEGRPINSAYITIESQHIPGIEKKLVSNDYTDEHKNLNGNLINNVSVDKTDIEYTLVFNNTNNIETTISIPYDKYKKSALFVDCDEEFNCASGSETIIPLRYITSIKEYGSTIIIEKIRNGEIIEERFNDLIKSYTYIPHIDDTELRIYAIDPEGTKTGITYLEPIISEPAIFSYDFKTSYNYAAPIFNDEVEYTYEETINGDKTYVTITISNPSELTSIDISSWRTYSVSANISTLDLTNCENLNYIKVPNIYGYSHVLSEFLPTRPSSSPGTMHAPILSHGFNPPECFNRGWIYTYDKAIAGGGGD